MTHNHDHGPETNSGLGVAFFLNLGFTILEIIGGQPMILPSIFDHKERGAVGLSAVEGGVKRKVKVVTVFYTSKPCLLLNCFHEFPRLRIR